MKIAYFLKNLPEKATTFIFHEIEFLRDNGIEVYIFPVWDIERSKLPQSITDKEDYNYQRFSLLYPMWAVALIYFSILKPKAVLNFFLKYRSLYGVKFLLKSSEAALVLKMKGVNRVHAHMLSISATRARIVSRLLDIPYTVTAHGSDLLIYPPEDSKELLLDAETVITPSKYNRKKIIETAGDVMRERVKVIQYFVDTDFFSPIEGRRKKEDVVELINVGRLHPVKGHVYLLQAAEILMRRGVEFHLTVVGGGEERRGLERLTKGLRLQKSVFFAGALYAEDLRDRLRGSDIFILSSISEGLPVSMLEAMSVGLTIVVPNITGIPEMIVTAGGGGAVENGILFEPKNSQDLASKLESVIKDRDLRKRLGDEARKVVLLKCSRNATYGKIADVIRGKES